MWKDFLKNLDPNFVIFLRLIQDPSQQIVNYAYYPPMGCIVTFEKPTSARANLSFCEVHLRKSSGSACTLNMTGIVPISTPSPLRKQKASLNTTSGDLTCSRTSQSNIQSNELLAQEISCASASISGLVCIELFKYVNVLLAF